MRISNYSLNYARQIQQGQMDIFRFLSLCRELGLEGASLHLQNLANTETEYLKRIRRAYLDQGLSVSLFTVSTDFGRSADRIEAELNKAREAIRVAVFLGAPLLRVFAGSPPNEAERAAAFDRSAAAVRRVCEEAERAGLPVGLQNHNHGALCRTGEEVLRFIKKVDHANLTLVLDTGQFAGSRGASGPVPPDLRGTDFMESIRQTAPLARYVRVKFYNPQKDGSEPAINYDRVFDILRGVHYPGFLDIVYEPGKERPAGVSTSTGAGDPGPGGGEDVATAIPRVVAFLRSKLRAPGQSAAPAPRVADGRYAGIEIAKYFEDAQPRGEAQLAFLEGPAVDRAGNVYFTNIPFEQIMKLEASAGGASARRAFPTIFRAQSNQANGLRFDRQGRLVVCEGAGRVTRIDPKTGQVTVLAEQYQDKPLGSPNDVEIDAQSRIYFTSRLANRDPAAGNVNAVYRIDPDGKISRILAVPSIDMPNGLATSPDDRIFYLIDADGRPNGSRRIRAYDLRPDGTVTNERLLYDFYPGRSGDGMAVDAEGNLYVAAGLHRRRGSSETLDTRPGIHVISPAGKLLAFLETPEDPITNCKFGGPELRTLYITCGKLLLSARTRIPGKPSYRPDA